MGRRVRAAAVAAPLAITVVIVVLPAVPSSPTALLLVAAACLLASAILLRPLAPQVPALATLGLLVPTAATAWATGRLLAEPPAARLAWMLGEEDNAHVVGVARELLAAGPAGAELAVQYGTSFATPGVALLRSGLVGDATGDPRLDAITAVAASATLLPVVVMLGLLLAAATVGAASGGEPPSSRAGLLLGSLLGGAVVQLLVVAVPLQLGFATLAWAVAWTLVGWAAAIGLTVPEMPSRTRIALAIQLAMAAVLLEGSWPFLAGALLLPVVVAAGPAILRRARSGGASARTRVLTTLVATLAGGALLAGSGAVRAVLDLGREAFTAGVEVGSSIVAVGPTLRAAGVLAVVGVVVGLRRARRAALVAVSASAGALLSLAALIVVALVVADGITGYGGSKLLLATVMLSTVGVAAVLAAGRLSRVGPPLALLVGILVLADPLGRLAVGWWDRTAPAEPPHAVATIEAIAGSDPGVPIRCRPRPGTPATTAARLAAYFCIVWMEDAFNADRSSGNRFAFFQTEDPTFDRVLDEAEAEGLYGFAYPLRLGPGWYGWDGSS